VLVSGLPPIRARKLRHYEDRNFAARLLAPPVLTPGAYADVPARRPDDWAGQVRKPDSSLLSLSRPSVGDGGLGQAREPALDGERRTGPAPEQLDLLGPDDDEDDVALAGAQMLAPVIAAHAANEGASAGKDLLPSF